MSGELDPSVSDPQFIDELLCLSAGLKVLTLPDPKTAPAVDPVRLLDAMLQRARARRPAGFPALGRS